MANRRVRFLSMCGFAIAAATQAPLVAQAPPSAGVAADPKAADLPPLIPTEAFASRGLLNSLDMSPDGRRIAATSFHKGDTIVVLLDGNTREVVANYAMPKKFAFEWMQWAGPDKLLVSIAQPGEFFGGDVRYTRLILMDLATGKTSYIGRKEPVVTGDDVIFIAPDGGYALVSMQRTIEEYPSVWRFELRDGGKASVVERPREGVWNWTADSSGQVRIGTGWRGGRHDVYSRSAAGGDLKRVERLKEEDVERRAWEVVRIEPGSDRAYVFYETGKGRDGFGVMDFAKRGDIEPVHASDSYDVTAVSFGPDGKPLGVRYTDDREQVAWLTPEDRARQAQLSRALQQPDVQVLSRAHDGSRMLVWAGSEADPGALYVYSPAEKRLDQFAEYRPKIDFRQLAPSRAVTYTARDGTPIRAYLTLPRGREAAKLPLIVMPHGGPYGIRDSLTYDDWVQLLANRGYAVLQPNYRGSGGYGDAFEKLGDGQIGRKMQDDLDDGMDWAVKEGFADPARVCMVGGSYGGYAALWAVLRNPERYRCAASWAGVTDWDSILRYDRKFFSPRGGRKWRERVEGTGGFDLDTVSPYRLAPTLTRPVLIAQGTEDTVVPPFQYHRFRKAAAAAKVKPVELLLEGEGHSFTQPANEKAWYDALLAFLAKHNPAE